MTVLTSITFGQRALSQIELTLTRYPNRYTVSVGDSEGLLHLSEFPYQGTGLVEGERNQALTEASEWFDNVHEAIERYLAQSGSQAIHNLLTTLN